MTVLWQTRYQGETVIDTDISKTKYADSKLDEVYLHNLGVSYQFNEKIMASINVNNVFDEEPEKGSVASGWDVQFDNIGRYVRAGIKISL